MTVIDVSREDVCRRAGPDVDRHRTLARRLLRDKMRQLIAGISVIGAQSRSRRYRIQVPVLKEYAFEFSSRREAVGYNPGPGVPERGSIIRQARDSGGARQPGGSGEGSQPVYEIHVDLDTIRDFLFNDLELPDILRKQLRVLPVEEKGGLVGITRHGPFARLHRRASLRQRNRRVLGQQREATEVYDGFVDDDLRYRRIAQRIIEISNAVCVFMMDVSGSMGWRQKYLARSFFWLLDAFVRTKYEHVEVVYIVHHSAAREVEQDQFFHTTESGGTMCSTAYALALRIIAERYPAKYWNVYAFHMSDGDNFTDDNEAAYRLAEELCKLCNLFGYGQVSGWFNNMFDEAAVKWSTMFELLEPLRLKHSNANLVRIRNEEDVYPQFRQMLKGERVKAGAP